jgi:hypothetical protein
MWIGDFHNEQITFIVLEECRHSIILGYDWLMKHNPIVDWREPSVTFSRCLCNGLSSSVPVPAEPIQLPIVEQQKPTPVSSARIQLVDDDETEDFSDFYEEADDSESLLPCCHPLTRPFLMSSPKKRRISSLYTENLTVR